MFHTLVQFLDECRICALESRSEERVLLANLLSLKSVMSESFSHAYVSSMVRAGDALDHDSLAEILVDDKLKISTLLPFDILKDAAGAWEDPSRPEQGYTPNLTGDVLTKMAHSRAMIQKSMRRLQDRHNIKAGTPTSGAYTDQLGGQSSVSSAGAVSNTGSKTASSTGTPKSWSRRKGGGGGTWSEGPISSGTGSANASSWSLYDPKHFSAPVNWKLDTAEYSPYGRHRSDKKRPLPLPNTTGQTFNAKKHKSTPSLSVDTSPVATASFARGTNEIDWNTVADSFHGVNLKRNTLAHAKSTHPANASYKSNIISPFCRQLTSSPVGSDDESDTEEDLSDEAVLARHQVVLDEMKEKLTAFMESRKRQQERKKSRQKNA